ncbi:MAG: ribonuclease HI [Desulfobacterium sp.]|nr:ribonuclease HI [Desulfobacterium sp.]
MPGKIPPLGAVELEKPVAIEKRVGAPSEGIQIYTDGSALNNPGPGGYGVILMIDGEYTELAQGYQHTTNNRMEMMAVITALEGIEGADRKRSIVVHSDSQYTINGITKGWAKNWRRKGWKKADGKPALNPDLWKRMLEIAEELPKLSFKWVKGHAGDPLNERADELANGAAQGVDGMRVDEGYVN